MTIDDRRRRVRALLLGLLLLGAGVTVSLVASRADHALVRSVLFATRQEPAPPPVDNAVITLAPDTRLQTMRGWQAVAQAGQHASPLFGAYRDAAYDAVVDAGINRLRLEIRSGSENPVDAYANWAAAGYPDSGLAYQVWRSRRYETINDNRNASVINRAGFHFTELDDTIDLVVNPLRSRLEARGEALYVNLTYVAFTRQITSGQYIHHVPDEYAEFMLAAFQHLQEKYGWVPDAIELVLEPDNVPQWSSGTRMGQTIVATAERLAAAGFTPDFVGPSTTCMNHAVRYFDEMIGVPDVKPRLKELAYHRYCGVAVEHLADIASRAQEHELSTSMLEWWDAGNTRLTLHEDLRDGRNSAWEQAPVVGVDAPEGLAIVNVDTSDPEKPVVSQGVLTRYSSLYFKHVRMGATRVGATSSAAAVDPLAFINRNGTFVVVVSAQNRASFTVSGLPEGTYGISYATADAAETSERAIVSGEALHASIPAAGVVTIFGKPPAPEGQKKISGQF